MGSMGRITASRAWSPRLPPEIGETKRRPPRFSTASCPVDEIGWIASLPGCHPLMQTTWTVPLPFLPCTVQPVGTPLVEYGHAPSRPSWLPSVNV